MSVKEHTIKLPSGEVTLTTGKLAKLSAGAVMLRKGGTVVLATADVDSRESTLDYFPLGVEYIERMYAGGSISGSRFLKREGFPTEQAIIKARQVDHTIRPLFPKSFKRAVSVVLTVLAYDGINDPEGLTVLGASAALMLSGIPFFGPAASVVVGIKENDELILNPNVEEEEADLKGVFAVSGVTGKMLNIEGWGKEVSEETMDKVIDLALEQIAALNEEQKKFVEGIAKPMLPYAESANDEELVSKIKEMAGADLQKALFTADKSERDAALREVKTALFEKLAAENAELEKAEVFAAAEYVEKKLLREGVLSEGKRLSGRALDQVRELTAEVDVLPTVHGSALFSRGLTQSLSIVTLGSTRLVQHLDGMEGEETKRFMHHYNMPSYTTGEAGRYNFKPGRREIGHGAIGENALKNMIPVEDDFPYTIRVVSEIMTSNGSTSMAATCASSMALMAAGVPMKEQVAGIGVGLVTEDGNDQNYRLLLDIEGVEDFYGDMDFKVTGTKNGITAIQFETKLQGVRPEIMKEAFRLSQSGRMQILTAMNAAIATSRTELSPTAPRVDILHIPQDKIGELIGPGGKVIRGIIEEAEGYGNGKLEIDISDDGKVTVTAVDQKQRDFAINTIKGITAVPEIGTVYEGVIDKIMPFGAFVDVTPAISGLIHVSEMSSGFVKDPHDYVREGQTVKVKLIKYENGKMSFSMKAVEADGAQQPSEQQA